MAKNEAPCPHCGKVASGRHVQMCGKNPNRVKGNPIIAKPVAAVAQSPQIVSKVESVKPTDLPNFTVPPVQQPKQNLPPPGSEIPSSVMVQPLVDALCGAFNARLQVVKGDGRAPVPQPPEPVSEDERKALAIVYGSLADKWFPLLAQKWGVEIACVIVTASVFGPRILDWWSYRAYVKKQTEGAKKESQGQATSGASFVPPNSEDGWKNAYEAAVQSGKIPVGAKP